jgi:hypothetical protein
MESVASLCSAIFQLNSFGRTASPGIGPERPTPAIAPHENRHSTKQTDPRRADRNQPEAFRY